MSLLSLLVSSLLSAVVVLVLLLLLLTGASSATPTTPTTDSNCACGCFCDDAAALPPWPTCMLTDLRALGGWPVDEVAVAEEGWLLAWPNNRRSTWQNKGGKGRGVGEREVNEGGGGRERGAYVMVGNKQCKKKCL